MAYPRATARPVAFGTRGLVASAHPLATLAGLDLLREGGGVVDAAIAVNAVLAVVQPHMCGLGGDLFCLYRPAGTREVLFLNGAGGAGARADAAALVRRGLRALPLTGPQAVTVPGCVAAWGALATRFATRPLATLLAPAIALATEGFPVSDLLAHVIAERRTTLEDPGWHAIFAPDGQGPRAGDRLRQPDLGRTLARIAKEGPDALYQGELAQRLARHLAAGGGFVTAEDLAAHAPRWQAPLVLPYRGRTVWQTPPPTQGLTLLQALALVEGLAPPARDPHGVDTLHGQIEALKLAYADRDRWLGDPDHVRVPVAALLDPGYTARRRAAIDRRRAVRHATCGDPAGDTTGFVVGTADGAMIAVIQSLYWGFGSGVVPPGTGITLHNRGAAFALDPASPNLLAPGKQPLHTLIATLVTEGDRPVAALATMGGHGQPQTHLQILTRLLDQGLDPQAAIEHPRVLQGRMRVTDPEDRLRVESRLPARAVAGLRRRGHLVDIEPPWSWTMGHAQALTWRRTAGGPLLAGGADPRGDGLALGY
jgi:gamma-glutamyltranspeptidase/glutathione hydrolase